MWATPLPSVLCGLVLVGQTANAADDNAWLWVVVPFLALVGVFVVYQQRQSGWTWREFAEGMLVLLGKALFFGVTMASGHPHFPPDQD